MKMRRFEYDDKIAARLEGVSITKEQALLALENVMSEKENELYSKGYLYKGKEFSDNDVRYEYLALMLAYNYIERDIILYEYKEINRLQDREERC